MPTRPNVFISATSGDLRTVRGIVKDALLTIGCHPVEQTNFPPDYRTVYDMLYGKISDCQALVHIVGLRYGAEPQPPHNPRRSYTQLEYDIARDLQRKRGDKRFRVYVFVCAEGFPYDEALDIEEADKTELQQQHRRALLHGDFLYETPADYQALKERIYALREEVIHLHEQLDDLKNELPSLTAAAVLQALDAESIAHRLRTEINSRFECDADLAREQQQNWQAIRTLERNRDMALARVDDVITTIKDGLAGNPDPIFIVASRIIETEGSDAALVYLESHQQDILAKADTAALHILAAEDKLHKTLSPLVLQADLYETSQQWEAALTLLKQVADKAPRWFQARNRLGLMLLRLARYPEAETEWTAIQVLAQNDAEKAIALNNLAALLQATNRLSEAEPLMRRVVGIFEISYGKEHPNVATALNNLAWFLKETNRLSEAEPLMRSALAIDEASYGKEHPNVAIQLNNLALLLQATNRLSEAEPLMRRVVEIFEISYGKEHPNFATALNNLALLLQATNRLSEAEPLMRRALAIDEASYGKEHPKVAIRLNNLATLLKATNRLSEAEPLMRRALLIVIQFTRATGHEHPYLRLFFGKYQVFLEEMKLTAAETKSRLDSLGPEAGYAAADWQVLYTRWVEGR
ncbi:MAG: tetratricopeptide repeat protein [Methylococcales bacterium]|nr:tetratricopeptide repeat protein [Methylococcales bacterium]